MKVELLSVEKKDPIYNGRFNITLKGKTYIVTILIDGIEEKVKFYKKGDMNIIQIENLVRNHFSEEIELINNCEPIEHILK